MSSAASRRLSPAAAGVLLGIFVVVALAVWALGRGGGAVATTTSTPSTSTSTTGSVGTSSAGAKGPNSAAVGQVLREPGSSATVRTKALYVLSVIDATGRAPSGYVGGRQFMNDGRGGTSALPRTDGSGRSLTYTEYDVNPKVNGVNRGPQRLVTGSDGAAYCTGDHYVTWTRLR
jgi:ribonuclease T1